MPKAEVKEIIPADSEKVFELIHDYEKRLEWDTLLQKAYLEEVLKKRKKVRLRFVRASRFSADLHCGRNILRFKKENWRQ